MSISNWPEKEQPRGKILASGIQSLSDAELLAIILRVGAQGQSAVDLARNLIKKFGSLRATLDASRTDLLQIHGMGLSKTLQIETITELGQRYLIDRLQSKVTFQSTAAVKRYLSARMRKLTNEHFDVMFLNAQHQLLATETLFKGTVNSTTIHPRVLIDRCLYHNAVAVILAHNHPSGKATPSEADRLLTKKLKSLLAQLDINLLDHFVVGESVYSFAEQGLC